MNIKDAKEKIKDFINRGEVIQVVEKHEPKDGMIMPSFVSGPKLDQWINEIFIFNQRYLKKHPLYDSIEKVCNNYKKSCNPCKTMLGYLNTLLHDDEFWEEECKSNEPLQSNDPTPQPTNVTTNIYVTGDANGSNLASFNHSPQATSSSSEPSEPKKSWFEKYWFPLILALIPVIGGIIVALIEIFN